MNGKNANGYPYIINSIKALPSSSFGLSISEIFE